MLSLPWTLVSCLLGKSSVGTPVSLVTLTAWAVTVGVSSCWDNEPAPIVYQILHMHAGIRDTQT